jgi:lipopolysaccharide biosynthesis regulator YciM
MLLKSGIVYSAEMYDKNYDKNDNEESQLDKALTHFDNSEYIKATLLFKKILKKNPLCDRARYQLAATYHLTKKNKLALLELHKIKTDPEIKQMSSLLMGNILLEEKKWNEALEIWLQLPKGNPDLKSMSYNGLAQSYEGLGQPSKAADAWSDYQSIQLKPLNEIFLKIAGLRVKAHELDKAFAYCRETQLFKDHKSIQEICNANVHLANGDKKQAMISAQAALAIDQYNKDAKKMLESLNK